MVLVVGMGCEVRKLVIWDVWGVLGIMFNLFFKLSLFSCFKLFKLFKQSSRRLPRVLAWRSEVGMS